MSTNSLKIINNGSKVFPSNKVVFEKFDFELINGITAIMGPNGCGKTTLLRIILGLEKLTSGQVLYQVSQEDRQSTILQDYNKQLLLSCSIRKNIQTLCNRFISNLSESQIEDEIFATLNKWGYDFSFNQLVGSLSGGQKQAFTLARALKNRPHLLVLDEPVSAIDFKRRLQILKSIKHFNTGHYTLISSHDINDAIAIADRIIVFNENLKPIINKKLPIQQNEITVEERLLSRWADELRKEVLSTTYVINL